MFVGSTLFKEDGTVIDLPAKKLTGEVKVRVLDAGAKKKK